MCSCIRTLRWKFVLQQTNINTFCCFKSFRDFQWNSAQAFRATTYETKKKPKAPKITMRRFFVFLVLGGIWMAIYHVMGTQVQWAKHVNNFGTFSCVWMYIPCRPPIQKCCWLQFDRMCDGYMLVFEYSYTFECVYVYKIYII